MPRIGRRPDQRFARHQTPFRRSERTASEHHVQSSRGKTTHAAWRSKPCYYAVSTEDRTINPDLERFMAKRMGARTVELKASHLSLISHPEEITRLILEAAGQQA
jgi:pimeloyl-ACP methyl ester carboxylesterase